MTFLLTKIVAPVLVIGILIFIHELGHFLFAKLCGVGVVRFSIGFGPPLLRWKRGETEYQLALIPLGGFVRMVGDVSDVISGTDSSDSAAELPSDIPPELLADRSRWFVEKSVGARAAIVFAGPLFNFLGAMIIIAAAVFLYGEEVVEEGAVIGNTAAGAPAEQAGIKRGDRVLSIDGQAVSSWEDLAKSIHNTSTESLSLVVARPEGEQTVVVHPQKQTIHDSTGEAREVFLIGIEPFSTRIDAGPLRALYLGGRWTAIASWKVTQGLFAMVRGRVSPGDLAGPIFIFATAAEQAKKGLEDVLFFMAFLSVSLAVLNLLPIPVLDGGHLLFFLVEALVGPISNRKKEIAQHAGLVFLLLLMGFAITNDIRRDPDANKVQWEKKK